MRATRRVLFGFLLLGTTACATASISFSEITAGSRTVQAESSKFNFLGLTPTPTETLHALRDDLVEQCGGGPVTGIVARASTVYVIIGVVEKIELSGLCG